VELEVLRMKRLFSLLVDGGGRAREEQGECRCRVREVVAAGVVLNCDVSLGAHAESIGPITQARASVVWLAAAGQGGDESKTAE
jgi:hypothetical protein